MSAGDAVFQSWPSDRVYLNDDWVQIGARQSAAGEEGGTRDDARKLHDGSKYKILVDQLDNRGINPVSYYEPARSGEKNEESERQ